VPAVKESKKNARIGKGKAGPGRPKGLPNKLTRTVKEAFETAFHAMQEQPGVKLSEWGVANPTEFYKLAARLIPAEINAKVTSQESAVELLARGTGGA
jgi:hypothetical protein